MKLINYQMEWSLQTQILEGGVATDGDGFGIERHLAGCTVVAGEDFISLLLNPYTMIFYSSGDTGHKLSSDIKNHFLKCRKNSSNKSKLQIETFANSNMPCWI